MKKITELAISKLLNVDFLKFIDRCNAVFNLLVDDVTFNGWTNFELFNNWVNYNSARNEAGYTKNKQGIVYIRGMIKNGTITSGTVIARLPLDYAPTRIHSFLLADSTSTNQGRIEVHPNGEIDVHNLAAGTTWICFDGVNYLV